MTAHEIVEKLNSGSLTWREAEPFFKAGAWHTGAQRPPAGKFNIWKREYWSLAMAVAWVAYRECEHNLRWQVVLNAWPEYAEDYINLKYDAFDIDPATEQKLPRAPFRLEALSPISLCHDELGGFRVAERVEDWKAARDDVWLKLQNGDLKAFGHDRVSGKRIAIPAKAFERLKPLVSAQRGELSSIIRDGQPVYDDVEVPRDDLERIWPSGVWIDRETGDYGSIVSCDDMADDLADIPLSKAVAWVATEGGKISFPDRDIDRWRQATIDVFKRLGDGRLCATGEGPDKRRVQIPDYEFSDARFSPHGGERALLDAGSSRARQFGCDIWRGNVVGKGHSQSHLEIDQHIIFDRLHVPVKQVLRLWPPTSSQSKRPADKQRAARQQDIDAAIQANGGQFPKMRQIETWRRSSAPEISRDSLRDELRKRSPALKRGPKGPRNICAG